MNKHDWINRLSKHAENGQISIFIGFRIEVDNGSNSTSLALNKKVISLKAIYDIWYTSNLSLVLFAIVWLLMKTSFFSSTFMAYNKIYNSYECEEQ